MLIVEFADFSHFIDEKARLVDSQELSEVREAVEVACALDQAVHPEVEVQAPNGEGISGVLHDVE